MFKVVSLPVSFLYNSLEIKNHERPPQEWSPEAMSGFLASAVELVLQDFQRFPIAFRS
jgi:hypothetical protein